MFNKSLIPIVVAAALAGCGTDDSSRLQGNSNGVIEIVGSDFVAGTTLTTTLSDADGILADTVSYLWSSGATGSSYTITEADEGLIITASALYTDEAGFIEAIGASTTIVLPTLDVAASVVKGPVSGASCEIFAIDDSGAVVNPTQASATSDATGEMIFSDVHFKGAGLVSCNGGTYTDESTGDTLDAPTLRAVIDVIESELDVVEGEDPIIAPNYVVSPLTEMAVQAAADDLTTFSDEAVAINARFGIRFDTTETYPTTVGVDALGADGAENADRYGSVLALISQLDADDADSDIATVLTDLVTDLADDGAFSEDTLTAFEVAQSNLQTTSEVAGYVDESLLDVIGASVGYNNDPVTAIIEGVFSGTVNKTATDPLTGTVTVTDPNFEEDAIVSQTDVALDYGTFSITANGNWSYTVDVTNDTVAALELGDSVIDSVTITSVDGTTAEIEARVAALTQVVKFSDPGGDSGELLIDVDNLRQGKLSASFYKEDSLGSDGNVKDAYITFYGSSGSVSESLVDLRIQGNQTEDDGTAIEPRFLVRGTDNEAYPGDMITAPFVEDQFYEVDIAWDLDASEQITITIDGEVIGGGAFSTAAVVDTDFENLDQWFVDGIQRIAFRFGDNDRTIPFGNFFVDNIVVYSDTAGTVSVFEDDFESYDEGDTLDGANSPYSQAVYAEVAVFDVGGTAEPTPAAFFDLAGAIASDETTSTGVVSVLDPDDGEAFVIQSTLMGTYGTLDILEDGSWTYSLDTANATIAALVQGVNETDTITIESFDGTTAELVIRINGVGGSTVIANAAVIRDTDASDTGELRYDLDPTLSGRLEVSFTRTTDGPSAYIALLNDSGSTSSGRSIVDMKISSSEFSFRDQTVEIPAGIIPTPGTLQNVIVTWEAATDADRPTVNVTIDGVALPAFTSGGSNYTAEDANSGGVGGVERVQFRFGSNSGVTESTDTFTINSFEVFSNIDGTASIFADDFSGFSVGDSLDTDNDASPYNSSTSEAVVELFE